MNVFEERKHNNEITRYAFNTPLRRPNKTHTALTDNVFGLFVLGGM